jgi:hypothetical protein
MAREKMPYTVPMPVSSMPTMLDEAFIRAESVTIKFANATVARILYQVIVGQIQSGAVMPVVNESGTKFIKLRLKQNEIKFVWQKSQPRKRRKTKK